MMPFETNVWYMEGGRRNEEFSLIQMQDRAVVPVSVNMEVLSEAQRMVLELNSSNQAQRSW